MRYGILAVFALALAAMPAMADTDVTAADLDRFATIYMGMENARAELAQEMATAEDEAQAQQIREGANERMIAVIEDEGWSVDRYNAVASAINSDAELREQVLAILQERS